MPPRLAALLALALLMAARPGPPGALDPQGSRSAGLATGPDGRALYQTHCSPCHGPTGRGDGAAARFLRPRPRDFRNERIHLASSGSGAPTDHDLFEIISAGLPGTAMPPFAAVLTSSERAALIAVLRGFFEEGALEAARSMGLDEEEARAFAAQETQIGPVVRPPPEPPDTVESLARGRLLFARLCASCHGEDGSGRIVPSTAEEVEPVRARDLRRGVLKGGHEPGRLFTRIRRGLPGTPMPALLESSASDAEVWDLVHYLGAILPASAQRLHDPAAVGLRAPRAQAPLGPAPEPDLFASSPEAAIALLPFREDEPGPGGLLVQALHDGVQLAFRVRYPDATWNRAGAPGAPDGLAIRSTNVAHPPILPLPGQPLPLDRALFLAGPKPDAEDPVFSALGAPFENPDQVCKAPIGPELVGRGNWQDGVWTVTMVVHPERGGGLVPGSPLRVSFAVFEGSRSRGPLPVAFSTWIELDPAP
jgi:mono/diheme cytochrome c family protein